MKAALSAPRVYLASLLLLALLSAAARSRPGYSLALGDTFFVEPRPAVVVERDPYLWSDVNAGNPSTNVVQLPYRLWWVVADAVGMPRWLLQALERGLFLAGAGLAMCLLASTVWPGRAWAPVAASAFYMFNVGRLTLELWIHLEWLYALLPLMLAVYLRMTQRLWAGEAAAALRWGLALAALVGPAFPVVLINLPQAVVVAAALTALAAATVGLALYRRHRLVLGVHALVAGLTVLLSAWWLWPTVQFYVLSPGEVSVVTEAAIWSWTHIRSSFLNELLMIPQWGWTDEHVPFFHIFEQPYMRALLLAPALAAVAAFWAARSQRERRASLLLYAGLLGCLFLGKGLHPPGSYLNQLAYVHLPGVWLLREPWGKLLGFVAVALALLIGLTLDGLISRLRGGVRRPQWATALALPLLSVFPLSVYPLFFRDVIYRPATVLPSPQVKIPDYWYEAAAALAADPEDSRLLLLPSDNFYAVAYTWGGYFADALTDRLMPQSTLNRDFGYVQFNARYSQLVDAIYEGLEDENATADPTLALALLNTRYLLVRGDIARGDLPLGGPIPEPRLEVIRARLQELPAWERSATHGALEVYRLKDEHFVPRFYAPDEIFVLERAADLVAGAGSVTAGSQPVFLAQADAGRFETSQATACQPRLTFEQINPARYEVQVEGDCGEYLLVFASGYDAKWQATIRAPGAAAATVPVADHLRANAYANAWHIRQAGPHRITVEYRPQRVFAWSVLVSLGGVGLTGIFWWLTMGQRLRRRRPVAEA